MKLKWEEPVAFRQACAEAAGQVMTRRSRLLAAITVAAGVDLATFAFQMFFFWLHKKDLGVPLYFYFVAPAFAGVFIYFLPTMAATVPATVILTDQGVHRNRALGTHLTLELWLWDSIAALTVKNMPVGKATFRVLALRLANEPDEIVLGLGTAPVEEIAVAVRQMGKTLEVRE
jgi:hypothetical protein